MRPQRLVQLGISIVSLAFGWNVMADGPLFTSDVVVESTNPDFILRDTDGAQWLLEADEPIANAFSISGNNGATSMLVLEDGAPANSLYVNSSGSVGIGTGNPAADLNIVAGGGGNATIRLQNDPSNPTYRWDIRGGLGAFQIAQGNSNIIPFSISNGAPSLTFSADAEGNVSIAESTIYLDRNAGAVGIGTIVPAASLHVRDTLGTAGILVEELSPTIEKRSLLELSNNGAPQLLFSDIAQATQWELNPNPNGNFIINSIGAGGTEFTLNGSNGNLRIGGDMRAGDFIVVSSRDSKENFREVDSRHVLHQVIDLPITQWNFKDNSQRKHIGPVAEDFKQTFGLSGDGKRISVIDVGGIALAAIQGMKAEHDAEVQRKSKEIAELKAELAELKLVVADLVATRGSRD